MSRAGRGEVGTMDLGREAEEEDAFTEDSSASSGCSSMDRAELIPLLMLATSGELEWLCPTAK